jgi:hypothetical protein
MIDAPRSTATLTAVENERMSTITKAEACDLQVSIPASPHSQITFVIGATCHASCRLSIKTERRGPADPQPLAFSPFRA